MINNKVIRNFKYLSLFQLINLLIPFILYPYLIKTIGLDMYGKYVYLVSIVMFFIVIINQGFDLSAIKTVGENIKEKVYVSTVFTSVFVLKVFFAILCLLLLNLLMLMLEIDNIFLANLIYIQLVTYNIIPFWIFQAIEEMKDVSIINIFIKIVSLLLILLLVKSPDDIHIYVYIIIFCNILALIITFIKLRIHKIKCVCISFLNIYETFSLSRPFFFSRAATTVIEYSNNVIIGHLIGLDVLAIYDLMIKVLNVFKIPLNILVQSLYPNVIKSKNVYIIKKAFFIMVTYSLLFISVCFLFGDIFSYFAISRSVPINIFNILTFNLLFTSVSLIFGATTLVVFDRQDKYNNSVYIGCFIYVFMLIMIYLLNMITLFNLTVLYVIQESIISLYRSLYAYGIVFKK